MKKISITSILIFLLASCAYCQCEDFLYTRTIKHSDFAYDRIAKIDEYMLTNDALIDTIFATQEGTFDIVIFERYVYGMSVLGDYSFFHEAIISKIDKGEIVGSYFISFDWKEPPMSTPIQVSSKKLLLTRVINVSDLNFRLLNENGINLIEEDCHLVIPESVDILQY